VSFELYAGPRGEDLVATLAHTDSFGRILSRFSVKAVVRRWQSVRSDTTGAAWKRSKWWTKVLYNNSEGWARRGWGGDGQTKKRRTASFGLQQLRNQRRRSESDLV
jgi:hypothetical protein